MTAPSKLLFSIVRSFFTSRVGEVHDICWPAPLMGYRRFPVTGTRTALGRVGQKRLVAEQAVEVKLS